MVHPGKAGLVAAFFSELRMTGLLKWGISRKS
jgi:hypothetical protein